MNKKKTSRKKFYYKIQRMRMVETSVREKKNKIERHCLKLAYIHTIPDKMLEKRKHRKREKESNNK